MTNIFMDITAIWHALTLLGTPEYWAFAATALVIVYLAFRRLAPESLGFKKFRPALRKFLLIFIPSILIVFGATLLIKNVAYIQRPCTPCPGEACNPFCDTDSSFPSGHAGTIFVVFSSLYVTFRKRLVLPPLIIPILVSYSRIALGVHTWIDVLAGALLGLAMPILVSIMLQKKHKSR
jgi:membrane-associated phospholipid phosphatase